jgi:hypothetical protein
MAKKVTIDFKPLKIGIIKVKAVGITPYLPEPMDMAVLEVYNKKKSNQIYEKDIIPEEEKVKEKCYYTKDGKIGIPVRAFYKAMIQASGYIFARDKGGMRNIKEGVSLIGDIIPLKFSSKEVVTHWGRNSGQSKSPRKIMRNQFNNWSCELEIQYNENQLSAEQIINILNWAGFHIGVGGFRKEKTGTYGSFSVKV